MTAPATKPGDTRPPASAISKRASRPKQARGVAALFLLPALVLLGALMVYPVIYTLVRSFYSANGRDPVGFANYVTMFSNESTFTAIRNNIIWVVVAPITCTILGLIFAVLMEKIRWKTAFKLIIFMPMAISMLAAGVIFRGLFQENPQLGAVNAALVSVNSVFSDSASYPGARPREEAGLAQAADIISAEQMISPGSTQNFPLVAIRVNELPESAADAIAAATPANDTITGTVWLDVSPGGNNAVLDAGEKGLPGIRVDAVAADGSIAGHATTGEDGTYTISGLDPGAQYTMALPAANFGQGFQGVSWLSASFITAVVILSYVWIWAGFAMVMIASGLSAIDRSLQEAARIDGANEWQVFTRITAPLLAPVVVVVFVTLIINVLKIFDLVYVIPPGVSKPAANVIAVEMWTVSFGGGNNQGLGSALAILLLILVLPSMWVNIKRFREERIR